jgi:hypothetical protein
VAFKKAADESLSVQTKLDGFFKPALLRSKQVVQITQQRAHRKTKRLKTATSNIDPVISEEEYIKWIISHQTGRA